MMIPIQHWQLMIDQNYVNEYSYVIGCDEVGRGPIAGPVVGCAVKLSLEKMASISHLGFTDSKKLSEKKRKELLKHLAINTLKLKTNKLYHYQDIFSYCLIEKDNDYIDEHNILASSLECMYQASRKQFCDNSIILIDGNQKFRKGKMPALPIVKGDSKSLAIAIASVIAKDFRDEKMKIFDRLYPGYGLASHAGYPTKAHKEAVAQLGVTPIHRKTFRGVKEFVAGV